MRGRRAAALAIALSAGTAAAAPSETDARRREAQALFNDGVKQAQAGNDKAALVSFRAAYAKLPSFRVLYNIGQLCERTGDAACALRAYQQYLREGDVAAKRREQVEASIRALSRSVGTIAVRSSAPGADVTIDDVSVGTTPLGDPFAVNPGDHKVTVALGDKSADKTVTVASGESAQVSLDLPTNEPAPAEARPAEAPPPRRPPTEGGGFPVVPWVITGALAASTVVSGVLTASAYSRYEDKRDSFPISRGELDDAQGSARTLFVVTGVLGAATVASAALATWFTVAPQKTGSRGGVNVAVGPGSVGVWGAIP